MITLHPKKEQGPMIIAVDYSKSAGKLGAHNNSFRCGPHVDRKKKATKNACRNKGRNSREDY